MKILTIVGARPQFIKAAPVSKALRKKHKEILVHTGQHYDENMSNIFFNELKIPKPDYNLEIGSGSHGKMTGAMLSSLEEIYLKENPDFVLVYGDTNSTIAGALAASKLLIPVIHVEAGLRSFNKDMPEEQNRILTDHISKFLLVPTEDAIKNLKNEGIIDNVYNIGDVMYDAVLMFKELAKEKEYLLEELGVNKNEYILTTIHRAENTNNIERLKNMIQALNECGENVILPLHPRTKKFIEDYGLNFNDNIKVIEPIGYLEMLMLESNSKKIVTDSGGVQKEAYFMGKPCITMRDETEWVETVKLGWNKIVGTDKNEIINSIKTFNPTTKQEKIFGDGNASEKIVDIIDSYK
ncbi:UDP-N-acetylglucosamine 2-epimerase (non-hydrolyzing) [Clostridium sp. NSJ-145]|uniref:non-hydrolyzing UDP-N-acetylglucosamine 2-epimerase n=1 Tax=Clostridium sp. NSJ-145 TaxID=2897777 RepID=UPI001E3458D5|nr:UDP-N-acetylglucosamine 2-epimerase (non-hydrolyzing) [Clostridium sp. NSJ-145]MCD2502377.1 UDP-N-acetylglucosamine 2-epimerase (non-hydrolyzing) [Clostridium sp. NSJ-145]